MFFNLSINDLLFFVSDVFLHNSTDDNILSVFAETILELINILQSGSEIAMDWFKNNKMIVNSDKFQVILLDKRKIDHINQRIVVDNHNHKYKSCIICRITRNSDK